MQLHPSPHPESYPFFLQDIKTRTRESQIKAARAVNQELIQLYWWLGSEIVRHEKKEGWKPRMMEQLYKDIQSSFPGSKGFSQSNLLHMRTFYLSYAEGQRAAGLLETPPNYCLSIPWGHHLILMKKVKNLVERDWYARKTVENGWSTDVLAAQIESDLFHQ